MNSIHQLSVCHPKDYENISKHLTRLSKDIQNIPSDSAHVLANILPTLFFNILKHSSSTPSIQALVYTCIETYYTSSKSDPPEMLLDTILRNVFISPALAPDNDVLFQACKTLMIFVNAQLFDSTPQLYCILSHSLDIAKRFKSPRNIRVSALKLIQKIVEQTPQDKQLILGILPGILSGMLTILQGDIKQGHLIFTISLQIYTQLTVLYCQTDPLPSDKPLVKLNEYNVLICTTIPYQNISYQYSLALSECITILYRNLPHSLSSAQVLLDTLIGISKDTILPEQVSQNAQKLLDNIEIDQEYIYNTILDRIYNLPSHLSTAESTQHIQILSGYLYLYPSENFPISVHQRFNILVSLSSILSLYIPSTSTFFSSLDWKDLELVHAHDQVSVALMDDLVSQIVSKVMGKDVYEWIDALLFMLRDDDVEEGNEKAELLYIMYYILQSVGDTSLYVDVLLDTLTLPKLWDINERNSTNYSFEQRQRHALTSSMILKLVTFAPLRDIHLQRILYPLLVKAGDTSNPMISETALNCIESIATPFGGIEHLLSQNADYLLNVLSHQLYYEPGDLHTADMLNVLMKQLALSTPSQSMCVLLESICKDILHAIDVYPDDENHVYRYTQVLYNMVMIWYRPQSYSVPKIGFKTDYSPIPYSDIVIQETESPPEHDDSESTKPEEPKESTSQKIAVDVLTKIKHFLLYPNVRILSLNVITKSVPLVTDSLKLYPLVAQIWTPLSSNLFPTDIQTLPHLLEALQCMHMHATQFLSRRMSVLVFPHLSRTLSQLYSLSKDSCSYHYKLQKHILNFIRSWSRYIHTQPNHINIHSILTMVIPYLQRDSDHSEILEEIIMNCSYYNLDCTYHTLAAHKTTCENQFIEQVLERLENTPEQPLLWMGYTL